MSAAGRRVSSGHAFEQQQQGQTVPHQHPEMASQSPVSFTAQQQPGGSTLTVHAFPDWSGLLYHKRAVSASQHLRLLCRSVHLVVQTALTVATSGFWNGTSLSLLGSKINQCVSSTQTQAVTCLHTARSSTVQSLASKKFAQRPSQRMQTGWLLRGCIFLPNRRIEGTVESNRHAWVQQIQIMTAVLCLHTIFVNQCTACVVDADHTCMHWWDTPQVLTRLQ